jgi:ABC-type antimicrobial peptide transport system ATPase subunit
MPPLLAVRDLRKSYLAGLGRCWARVHVLRGASFTLAEGERLAIVGSAASGKTTLLHCLAGLRRPDAGQIRWSTRSGEAVARSLCTLPGHLSNDGTELLLIDLSEREHSIVEWSECCHHRATSPAGWILAARRLGPIAHLCDTVLLLEEGLLRPRAGSTTRRVAEPRRQAAVAPGTPVRLSDGPTD